MDGTENESKKISGSGPATQTCQTGPRKFHNLKIFSNYSGHT